MALTKEKYIAKYGEEAWITESIVRKERSKKYYTINNNKCKEKSREYRKKYYIINKEKCVECSKQYMKTDIGRSMMLLHAYKQHDLLYNRGECTLTQQWIIDNIFNSSCIYCGDSDWTHLGADRIDNSKPHTPENCVCACGICNIERGDKFTVEEFKEYRKLHPRKIDTEKSWEIVEMKGIKVLKKRAI